MTKEEKKEYNKAYRKANKDKAKAYSKAYRQANKDKIKVYQKVYQKAWQEANKDKIKARQKAYREVNKDKAKVYQKAWQEANKEKEKANRKAYYESNKDKIKANNKAYREANKDKINSQLKNRRKTDPIFKLRGNLRNRICTVIKSKGYKKESKTAKILGASYTIVKKHLERQFTGGMNWDNYGDWHVDHIIPLASANTKDELINLFHFRNLQPLWAADNLSKGCKIE